MDAGNVRERLGDLMAALQTLETTLVAQHVPLDMVSDFKSSVDDLRLRLWGQLTARNADDQQAFQQRFRLRRLREMCLQIGTELREGALPMDDEEVRMLVLAARSLVTAAGGAVAA